MARGVNKAILIGHLGRDPEVRYSPAGAAVANANIATTEQWKDKQTGEQQEKTEWHRLVFFGRLAEIVGEYLKKGSQIYVEGRLQTRKWQDKEGVDRWSTEIVANDMQMLGGRGEAGGNDDRRDNWNADNHGAQPTSAPAGASPPEDFDDDLPF